MKNIAITKEDLKKLTNAEFKNLESFDSSGQVNIDSRKVSNGDIFVAIKGERLDGHNFIEDTVEKGAALIIAQKDKKDNLDDFDLPIVFVEDTIKAYGKLANIWRKKLNATVVSLTGSNGKTTTKEILSTILAEKYRVSKTESNNNNHIGVPLTILSTQADCEVLVLEHGTNHFGEIEYTANIAHPDYSMITNIGDSHLEFLENRQGVYKEKSALLGTTEFKPKGKLLNFDDPILKEKSINFNEVLTYGFDPNAEIKGHLLGFTSEGKTCLRIKHKEIEIEKVLPVYGRANAMNVLSAVAAAIKLDLSTEQIISGIDKIKPVNKRLNVKKFNNFILIDDTYNANPDSTVNALEILSKMESYPQKVAVLGDMFELGMHSEEMHRNLAEPLGNYGVNKVLLLGEKMKYLAEELTSKRIKSQHFDDQMELRKYVHEMDISDSAILVKGSRGMKMEQFVEILQNKDK
jgi:UDP-N-acetylmuramoyl-tripeptide--D-alanyl-D-alanine ligase